MRILMTADPELQVPPQHYGGIERIIDLLVVGLQARGHEVGLVAHPDSTCPADRLFAWRGSQSQNKLDIWRNTLTLQGAIREFKPDLVHSFSRILYLLPVLGSPLPKIMSYQRQPTPSSIKWAAKLAGNSLTFTGCSEHICRQGRAFGGVWQAIHNCVELSKYTFQRAVDPQEAPLVFLSRVERIKGAHAAIAAALKTKRKLLIAGNKGTSAAELDYWDVEIAPHLGQNGIEYVGEVNDREKNALLGRAAAMLVPIEWEEPFGIVFAEALACGTPVISCPRGALPEIVRPGIDGYLINNMEETLSAIANLPRIDRSQCRQRAEECFSAGAIVQKYERLYLDCLSGR
jgi:glycosyltransferase involved in cell wall biosynthesis